MTKLISIVTPTFNESENIEVLYGRLCEVWAELSNYDFELVVIDNASTDDTVKKLRKIALNDHRVKIIINNKNYGHIRSPYWGMLQASGSAVIFISSDLQDPPELIPRFINLWEEGWKVVMATKPTSKINSISHGLRKVYYKILNKISKIDIVENATGFGIYDRKIIELIRKIDDKNPYFKGLVCELGYKIKTVTYEQEKRLRGITKNNYYTLFDLAMTSFVSNSLVPIRIASLLGILIGIFSIIFAMIFLIIKLIWWSSIPFGMAPLVILISFLFGLIFIFIGLLGEYISFLMPYVKNRPIVIEEERINF